MALACRVLPFCLALVASCARADVSGNFGVATPNGVVVSGIRGMAKGFTNAELTRLIQAGLAEAYPIRCDVPSMRSAPVLQMIWNVRNENRKPTAIVSVSVIRSGNLVDFAYSNVPAPDAFPPGLFRYEVSNLARRVLGSPTLSAPPPHC